MTVAQTFPRLAGRLACILALSCATIFCAITPALFAADEDSIVAESDARLAGNICSNSDSALPARFCDSCDERLKLTDDWFGAKDHCVDQGVTL